jgi:hypothetical protein
MVTSKHIPSHEMFGSDVSRYRHVWHILQHIFMRKQQSKTLGSYRNKNKDTEAEIQSPEPKSKSRRESEPMPTLFEKSPFASGLFPKISQLSAMEFHLEYNFLNSAETDQQYMCITRIKNLPFPLLPITEFTKQWLSSVCSPISRSK